MGKNDFLTPKAIANRIKAKGLQKLRWYCQLCQKQCRDENGFKCHQMSDSHRRQMEVFGQNPQRVVEGYSEEFENSFLDHLKQSHPFSRVSAKVVYNEFINDRHHIHMNSTKWLTLTEFVTHLGREGKCKIEETEKGWFITLIQKDPMKELDDERRVRRDACEREEEERHRLALEAQVERARKHARPDEGPAAGSDLDLADKEGPLVLGLASALPIKTAAAGQAASKVAVVPLFGDDDERGGAVSVASQPRKRSKLDELMQQDLEAKKAAAAKAAPERPDSSVWLSPGIVVKVMSKELEQHGYYKKKAIVMSVSKFVGEVEMLDSGDVLRVDQAQLETVLPSPGGTVLVVLGPHRGMQAILEGVDTKRYKAQVTMLQGTMKGKEVWLDYEEISKWKSS